MAKLSKNKQIFVSVIVVVCVCLLLAIPFIQPLLKDKSIQESEVPGANESNANFQEPLIDPSTHTLNGLTNEEWFSEIMEDDGLNLITEDLGISEFNSTDTDQRNNQWYGPEEDGEALDSNAPALKDKESSGAAQPREIEEADIIRLIDDTLYILNSYRGLIIIDVSEPDEPEILARVPLFGNPVEMYIVEPKAYVVLTHYYNSFLWAEDASGIPKLRQGSEIVVIDLTDTSEPKVQQYFEIDGYITNTRRIGEVIYAVANNYDGYDSIRASTVDSDDEITNEPPYEESNEADMKRAQWLEEMGKRK